ncbi:MAG: hypothetical protein ACYTHK_13065 [Planctomycetota bacterium]|jgi:hypothetical protein
MRLLILLPVLAGCMAATKDAGQAALPRLKGAWIGLDDSGATWWRLDLREGRLGKGAFESNGTVVRYDITSWSSDPQGGVRIDMVRGKEANALDRAPPTIRLTGRSDDTRLRLMHGKTEIVLLREQALIDSRDRLKKGMEER